MKLKQNIVRGGVGIGIAVLLSSSVMPIVSAASATPTPPPASQTPTAVQTEAPVINSNPDGAFNVVVSPPSIGLQTKPGVSVSTDLQVRNQGLVTEHVKVTLMTFGARGQDGTPQLIDIKPADDFAKWAHFSTTRFDAEPNVWQKVNLTISPPASAAFGYYYAVIFSRDGAEKQVQKKKANLLGAVASLVLLDVQAPGAVRKTKIAEFSTAHKAQEFLPASFVVRLQNTGNTHVAPRGNIFISRGGKNIALIEVNLKKGYILPDSYRKFTADWKDGTPIYKEKTTADGKTVVGKDGKPETKLNWDKFSMSKLRFGKYNAKLVMVYNDGQGDVSNEATLSFWVIPWRIIGGLLLIGIFVAAGLWALIIRPFRRRLNKKPGYAQRR